MVPDLPANVWLELWRKFPRVAQAAEKRSLDPAGVIVPAVPGRPSRSAVTTRSTKPAVRRKATERR
jgi:hypothetical protein